MDEIERLIINELQGNFPICPHPYAVVAERLGITEQVLIKRISDLLDRGILSRFGPMYHAERMGGALTLAAMRVPEADFERVTALVNAHPEVAHNYARAHDFNMWFVLATENAEQITEVIHTIEQESGFPVFNMPKEEEFYLNLRFNV